MAEGAAEWIIQFMTTEGAGATRGGGDDFHNEDAFLVRDALGLYAVCDGDSSRPAGETAASLAVAAVEAYIADAGRDTEPADWLRSSDDGETVEAALRHALLAMLEAERIDPELRGMATTLTLLLTRGTRGVIGHVGDSRAYLLRRGRAHLLTHDHALTDARESAPGDGGSVQIFGVELEAGDRLVLCTDGAGSVVAEPALARAAAELSPAILASRIASAAHRRDANQDATVVVVRVRADDDRHELSLPSGDDRFRHRVLERGGKS